MQFKKFTPVKPLNWRNHPSSFTACLSGAPHQGATNMLTNWEYNNAATDSLLMHTRWVNDTIASFLVKKRYAFGTSIVCLQAHQLFWLMHVQLRKEQKGCRNK